ncbi:GIN domain-containing protein [Chloroflexota bacterium]
MMKKAFLILMSMLLLLFPIGTIGCDFSVTGSGNLQTRDFDLGKFNSIDVGDFFVTEISQGDANKVSITADENIFNYLSIDEDEGVLRLSVEGCRTFRSVTLKAKITMPHIEQLILSSGATAILGGFNDKRDLELKLSGFSSLNIKEMATNKLSISISNSKIDGEIASSDVVLNVSNFSNIRLHGSARNISATASENSHLELSSFPLNNANITLRNFSTASLSLNGRLDAQVRQNSVLVYSGSPIMDNIDIDGLSKILHE